MTFSIVARDPDSGAFGVGVQTHFLAVGAIATFAEPGVGAIATQAFASRQYGALGLELLRAGRPAAEVLDALLRLDRRPELRQVGIVDSEGEVVSYTGARCVAHAGHQLGKSVAAQGNMLASADVWEAVASAYQASGADFPERILTALEAGDAAGGDARGRQSAHLYIVSGERMAAPWNGVVADLRVDDHPEPLAELRRLVALHRGYSLLGGALFEDGPLFEPPETLDLDSLEHVLGDLTRAGEFIEGNFEPFLWRGVLLARAGRTSEAAQVLAAPLRQHPPLAVFFDGLVAAGFLPPAVVAELRR